MGSVAGRASASDAAAVPRLRPDVYASALDEDCVVYDPHAGKGYILNVTGARIWSLCDGTRTVVAIAEEMANAYHVGYDDALADVRELVGELESAGLLSSNS